MLSVVIPTLNEATALPRLLGDLRKQTGIELDVVIADGGSTDRTRDVAEGLATVIKAPRGRGAQMNAGAAAARGTHLLFLHADSRLEHPSQLADAVAMLEQECTAASTDRVAGHFALRFERSGDAHEGIFRLLEEKSALNRPGTINGDQGCLLRSGYFNELGGYDESRPFLEDQKFAARVFETGRWVVLPGRLTTSARRFEVEGVRERLALMALLMGAHGSDFAAFLDAAPDIYASQDRARQLALAPFYERCRKVLRQQGPRGMARVLFRAGRYVRGNCWQLFWWNDHRHHPQESSRRHPTLDFFDRRVAALLDNVAGDAAATALVTLWLFGWLPLTENRTP